MISPPEGKHKNKKIKEDELFNFILGIKICNKLGAVFTNSCDSRPKNICVMTVPKRLYTDENKTTEIINNGLFIKHNYF